MYTTNISNLIIALNLDRVSCSELLPREVEGIVYSYQHRAQLKSSTKNEVSLRAEHPIDNMVHAHNCSFTS